MTEWEVTWFDAGTLKVSLVLSDPYGLMSEMSRFGVNIYAIVNIKRIPVRA